MIRILITTFVTIYNERMRDLIKLISQITIIRIFSLAGMLEMEETCFFVKLCSCSEKGPLSEASVERITKSSKLRDDDIHIELEAQHA